MIEGFKLKETRFGVEAVLPWSPANALKWVKDLRLRSFHMQGARLFNSCPSWVRDKVWGTVAQFKTYLNKYLSHVPDQPRDHRGGNMPEPYDSDIQTPSNSLVHWGQHLREKKKHWVW